MGEHTGRCLFSQSYIRPTLAQTQNESDLILVRGPKELFPVLMGLSVSRTRVVIFCDSMLWNTNGNRVDWLTSSSCLTIYVHRIREPWCNWYLNDLIPQQLHPCLFYSAEGIWGEGGEEEKWHPTPVTPSLVQVGSPTVTYSHSHWLRDNFRPFWGIYRQMREVTVTCPSQKPSSPASIPEKNVMIAIGIAG